MAPTPEGILRQLHQLWASLAGSEGAESVLRACTMTLILAVDEKEEAPAPGELLAELMHDYPSRAVVLRIQDGSAPLLDSRVFAQCWMPFGERNQQICCEQIEIRISEASLRDVPRLVSGLVAPDLPVVLICPKPALLELEGFGALLPLTGSILLDSRRSMDPRATLARIAQLRTAGHDVRDLAWTALTGWRYRIATAFDERGTLARLKLVRRIDVKGSPPKAWYLAAWLETSLGWPVDVRLLPGAGIDEAVLSGDEGFHLRFTRTVTCTELPDQDLLRQELAINAVDAAFARALPGALRLSEQ